MVDMASIVYFLRKESKNTWKWTTARQETNNMNRKRWKLANGHSDRALSGHRCIGALLNQFKFARTLTNAHNVSTLKTILLRCVTKLETHVCLENGIEKIDPGSQNSPV